MIYLQIYVMRMLRCDAHLEPNHTSKTIIYLFHHFALINLPLAEALTTRFQQECIEMSANNFRRVSIEFRMFRLGKQKKIVCN